MKIQNKVWRLNRHEVPVKGAIWTLLASLYIDVLEAYPFDIGQVASGREAVAHSWPWIVSIELLYDVGDYTFWYHICCGSLIGRDVVLTAAHCATKGQPKDFTVVLGQHDRITRMGKEQRRSIKNIIVHEDYDKNATAPGLPNDIAIMKLSEPAEFNYYVEPVPLAPPDEIFLGNRDCYLTEWAKTSSSYVAAALQEVKMRVIDNKKCQSMFANVSRAAIFDTHICIYDGSEDKAACKGDSGGPFVCKVDGVYVLAGVTTWGVDKCKSYYPKSYPSVCTRISMYRDWITKNL